MGHHYLRQFLLLSILGTIIQNGNCQFKSFKEIDLGDDDYLGRQDRSDDFYDDEDINVGDQESLENAIVDAPYRYQFNVQDDEEQVYQHQKQQREKGVVNGEYSWVDGAGTRHTVVYRADDTGYHVLDMRKELNVVKIKEKKSRKPKKNGSRRAKVEALRASKLGERGWRFNNIDNEVTKVIKPVTEKTRVLKKVKRVEIPELVRSFKPIVSKSGNTLSNSRPISLVDSLVNNLDIVSKDAVPQVDARKVPENDFIIQNRPLPKLKEPVAALPLPLLGSQKGRNKAILNYPSSTPSLSIIDLIPTSEKDDSIVKESVIPRQPNHRRDRPTINSRNHYLNLIPITELEGLKNKEKDSSSRKKNIDLVTLPPVTSPRPRIFLPILTKNEREEDTTNFNLGFRKASKKVTSQQRPNIAAKKPQILGVTGKPPVVISTTRLPVSTNIPNPIFEEKTVGEFEVETTFENAQKKKEDEIIAQIRKQLYEVLGQKRKQSKLNEPNNQGNGEDVSGKESSRSGTGPSITSNDLAGILSNIGISAPTPDVLNPNIGAIKTVKNLPSKADKRKKKVKKIVKSRPRLRKPPPTFANFGLVDLNEDRKDLKLSKSRVKAKSLLQKIPGISEKTKSNPNRRRKLLRVIKKKKQLGKKFDSKYKNVKIVKAKGPSKSSTVLLRPSNLSAAPQNNNLLAEHAGGNNLANKVLLQAVLETENNVGGDVEESVRSQIFITPKGLPKKDATDKAVQKTAVLPNVIETRKESSESSKISTRKIVLPAQGSVQLRQAEVRSSNGGNSRKIYTLPPKVLQPIGFVHPSFSLVEDKEE